MAYNESDLMRLAKRIHNTKRKYLLVNPLQAKHLPVSPKKALAMMQALGNAVAIRYPETRLVIGFAETATAIGAIVASCLSEECTYIHTTREETETETQWITFLEEHSHAMEQQLVATRLKAFFANTDTVVFVDDELSTGKTLLNIIDKMRAAFPELCDKKIVVASVINRLSEENEKRFEEAAIAHICLLKLQNIEYTALVEQYPVREAETVLPRSSEITTPFNCKVDNPRAGVRIGAYYAALEQEARRFIDENGERIQGRVLVLGTEECMLPALVLGNAVCTLSTVQSVKCHATTRSPIGISKTDGYPIQNGYRLHSFYDEKRITFLYNIEEYDTAIIITDAAADTTAIRDVTAILYQNGCNHIFYSKGERNV